MLPKETECFLKRWRNRRFAITCWRCKVGEWLFLMGRILPLLAWQQCFTHLNPAMHTHKKTPQWIQGHVSNSHMCLRSALHVLLYPLHAGYWHCKECLTCCGKTSFSSCFNTCSLMPWEKVFTKYMQSGKTPNPAHCEYFHCRRNKLKSKEAKCF